MWLLILNLLFALDYDKALAIANKDYRKGNYERSEKIANRISDKEYYRYETARIRYKGSFSSEIGKDVSVKNSYRFGRNIPYVEYHSEKNEHLTIGHHFLYENFVNRMAYNIYENRKTFEHDLTFSRKGEYTIGYMAGEKVILNAGYVHYFLDDYVGGKVYFDRKIGWWLFLNHRFNYRLDLFLSYANDVEKVTDDKKEVSLGYRITDFLKVRAIYREDSLGVGFTWNY
jgi:hypothetical protein